MTMEYLKRYIAVAECLNFRKAAQCMEISQPALSYCILALERDLGVKLLVRDTTGVELTREGKRFLSEANGIVQIYESTLERIAQEEKAAMSKLPEKSAC